MSMIKKFYRTHVQQRFCKSRLGMGIGAFNSMEDMSFEDQNFLKFMDEKSRKVEEHYEIPLPLKDRSVKFPNNRNITEKRLYCLKSRFIRSPGFFEDKGFIEEFVA